LLARAQFLLEILLTVFIEISQFRRSCYRLIDITYLVNKAIFERLIAGPYLSLGDTINFILINAAMPSCL